MANPLSTVRHHFQATCSPMRSLCLIAGLYLTVRAITSLSNLVRGHYAAWLSQGPGGLRHSQLAWLIQTWYTLTDASTDLTGTEIYNSTLHLARAGPGANHAYLDPSILMPKKGERPMVPRFAVPQRQCQPGSPPQLRQIQLAVLDRLVVMNPDLVTLGPSILEGSKTPNALFLKDKDSAKGRGASCAPTEVLHLHSAAEGSAHVVLSLADAKQVVGRRWGQRHLGSGGRVLPLGFTLIYAPTTVEEVRVYAEILRAGIAFMVGSTNVRGVDAPAEGELEADGMRETGSDGQPVPEFPELEVARRGRHACFLKGVRRWGRVDDDALERMH